MDRLQIETGRICRILGKKNVNQPGCPPSPDTWRLSDPLANCPCNRHNPQIFSSLFSRLFLLQVRTILPHLAARVTASMAIKKAK